MCESDFVLPVYEKYVGGFLSYDEKYAYTLDNSAGKWYNMHDPDGGLPDPQLQPAITARRTQL